MISVAFVAHGTLVDRLEVGAAHERTRAGRGEHRDADVAVVVERAERVADLVERVGVDRVHRRTVERDRRDVVFDGDRDIRHVSPGTGAQSHALAHLGAAQRRHGLRRLAARRHLLEQIGRDVRDLVRGRVHQRAHLGVRLGDAGDLADELHRGGVDLLGGRRRLEAPELSDVPAHRQCNDASRAATTATKGRYGCAGGDCLSTTRMREARHIVLITIDRPEARNSADMEHFKLLREAWERFRDDDDAWVAIVTGVGDSFFVGRRPEDVHPADHQARQGDRRQGHHRDQRLPPRRRHQGGAARLPARRSR